MLTRPVWAEVSRSRLLANYQSLCRAAGPQADLMPVVKADAYGHGALICAPLLAKAGASWLGVTSTEEGVRLRIVCPQTRILLMSGIFPGEAQTVIDHHLTPVVWEHWQLDLLEKADANIAVHLEIDTGMSRQGVRVLDQPLTSEASALLDRFRPGSPLQLEGLMTHFASPEVMSSKRPNPQLRGFAAACHEIAVRGLRPRWLHAGNSSTLSAGQDWDALEALAAQAGARFMVRPGLALYGYLDRMSEDGLSWSGELPALQPVLEWKTQITSLRTLELGDTAGYGNTFVAAQPTRLALLPLGYADGLNRLLSNRGHVLVHGRPAQIAGRVSMDQTMVDVTDIADVAIGDEVVLLGAQGEETQTAWDLADLTGTIPWDVLCAISSRVPRLPVPELIP